MNGEKRVRSTRPSRRPGSLALRMALGRRKGRIHRLISVLFAVLIFISPSNSPVLSTISDILGSFHITISISSDSVANAAHANPAGAAAAVSTTPQATSTGTATTATAIPAGPPPTYTIGLPTRAPFVTPVPDEPYVHQAIDAERSALLAEVSALPLLTNTITGTLVSGLTGGRIASQDGGLTLGMRPGIVPVTDTIHVQMSRVTFTSGDSRGYRNGHPLTYAYELTATRGVGGPPVEQFDRDAVLVWNLGSIDLSGFPINVYRYNEQSKSWEEVPSSWHPQTNQLIATTPHFSLYVVDPIFDKVKNYLPSVSNFEVDLQTGTSNVQYPINLPPGPGGFGPKVSLSYNSGNTDRVSVNQQGPSPIGWGWTLSTNYIAATQHHYPNTSSCENEDPNNQGYHPWTASIVVDGVNGDLVLGEDGYWHTSMESFARVQYVITDSNRTDDAWIAWDTSGTKYEFESRALVVDEHNYTEGLCKGTETLTTYRWMLTRATDVHGNVINYTYQYERPDANHTLTTTPITDTLTRAVYPYQILYGGKANEQDKLRVSFDTITRTIGLDSDVSAKDEEHGLYQSWRINKVKVERRQEGSGSYAVLRSYELEQSYSIRLAAPEGQEEACAHGVDEHCPHLTLLSITAKGKEVNNQQQQLPKTYFDYISPGTCPDNGASPGNWDRGKICWAHNGYGGHVGFYYDAVDGDKSQSYRRVRAKRVVDGTGTDQEDLGGESRPYNVLRRYQHLGAATNDRYLSAEASPTPPHPGSYYPLHEEQRQFRGFGWVREFVALGETEHEYQVIDHYYSQDDTYKGKEWRVQVGKTGVFTETMNGDPSTSNWTVSAGVQTIQDPNPRTPTTTPTPTPNGVWELRPSQNDPTPYIKRNTGVTDGSDVDLRFMLYNDDHPPGTPTPTSAYIEGVWKLENANGNGEYWGLKLYPRWDDQKKAYEHAPKVVWAVMVSGVLTTGERDLSIDSPLRPQFGSHDGFRVNDWNRLHLHTSPDGRFALQLYFAGAHEPPEPTKDYIQIKSGDAASSGGVNGKIPLFPTGQTWKFKHEIVDENGGKYSLLADAYHEWRTLYSQVDSVFEDKTHPGKQAQPFDEEPLVGQTNNTHGMNIRFVPLTDMWTTKYGEGAQVGQVKRTRTTYEYDNWYGNQTRVNEFGDAAAGAQGDERSTISSFAVLSTTTQYIVDRPAWTNVYQGITNTVLLAHTRNYYDHQTQPGVIPNGGKGDLTMGEQLGVSGGVTTTQAITQSFDYDTYGNPTLARDPRDNPTTTQFDPYYHTFPMTVTHPLSSTGKSEYTYYDFTTDSISATVDLNETTTYFQSDQFGRPHKTWIDGSPQNNDPANEIFTFSDINKQIITPTQDLYIRYEKRLEGTTYGWHTRHYDGRGRVLQDVSPKNPANSEVVVVTNFYTVTGAISSTTMPYLATASPTQFVPLDPTKPKTINYYDGAGRPSVIVNPDSSQIIYDYSLLQWVGVRDEASHQKWQRTDMLGRTDYVWEEDYPVLSPSRRDLKVTYAYDMLDRLTTVTRDPENTNPAVTSIYYDQFGRKNKMVDPDMGTWHYAYDKASNLIEQRDAKCLDPDNNICADPTHQIFFRYDSMNRITGKYYGPTHNTNHIADVKYYYDHAFGDADAENAKSWGRLRHVEVTVQGQGQTKANGHGYLYDFKGRPAADVVTTTMTTRTYTVTYTYDVGDRLLTTTYPDPDGTHEVATVSYNSQGMGLPSQVSTNKDTVYPVYSATYNERGQLSNVLQGSPPYNNVLTTAYSYNVRGWLTNTLVTANNGSDTLLNLSMSFTADGNISQITNQNITNPGTTNPTFTNDFSYDGLDRLKSAESSSAQITRLFDTETYTFDTYGRMNTRTIAGTQHSYTYGDPKHIDAPTAYRGNSYEYDENGNQTERTVSGVTQSRTFDPENRMVTLIETRIDSSRTEDEYIYDGNGNRIIKISVERGPSGSVVRQTETLYIGNLYEEEITNGQNPPYISYYYLGAKLVGMRRMHQPADRNGQFRIVGDHLGSTTLVVDTATPPVVRHRQYYKPYGEVAWEQSSWPNNFRPTDYGFTGQRLDSGSGLMYYGARYYDPVLGHFTEADPIAPGIANAKAENRYSYVLYNPIRYIDPTGNCEFDAQGNITRLDCTVEEFERMSIQDRIRWMKQFAAQFGYGDWFNNIIGILQYFSESLVFSPGMGKGSWMSWADAATLEAIQNGHVLYTTGKLGGDPKSLRYHAAQRWAAFFAAVKSRNSTDAERKRLWGLAEMAGIAYGNEVADARAKPKKPMPWTLEGKLIQRFIDIGNQYRKMMATGTGGIYGAGVGASAGSRAPGLLGAFGWAWGGLSGYMAGEWFTDPRSTVPGTGRSPVYYAAHATEAYVTLCHVGLPCGDPPVVGP